MPSSHARRGVHNAHVTMGKQLPLSAVSLDITGQSIINRLPSLAALRLAGVQVQQMRCWTRCHERVSYGRD